jgi:hypothetical protein
MLLAAFLAASTLAGTGAEVPPGTPIVAIRVVQTDIFDLSEPGTSAWPYRWANALHVLTRERFIRSLLLFRVGDKLDPARLAESERILRGTGFLNPVNVSARPVPGGAEVVVEAHDQWTLEAGVSFGIYGRRKHKGASLSDENFLGWGKTVEVEFDSDPERTTTTFTYEDPLFLETRWQLQVQYKNASDGKTDAIKLEYPFFALGTPYAGGVEWRKESQKDYLYSFDHKAVSGEFTNHHFLLWGGIRLPGDHLFTNRLTVGVFSDENKYADWTWANGNPYPTPDGREMTGFQVGWDHEVDRWKVVRGFRAWQRQEDVALGPNWSVNVGASLPLLGADRTRFPLTAQFNIGSLTGTQYSWFQTSFGGRFEHGTMDNAVTQLVIGTARTGPVGWRARLQMDLGHNLDLDQQLTLGADTGLRGWDPDTFDGTSRAVANVEWRHQVTGEVLHLAILGIAIFADVGKTWNPRVGPSTEGLRKDAGVGVLIESTRASLLRVVRIEAGWPDRGKGPVILVSGQSLF